MECCIPIRQEISNWGQLKTETFWPTGLLLAYANCSKCNMARPLVKDITCCFFRQIPIDPGDYPLMGMYINDALYFNTTLLFGLQSATLICQRTT